MTRAGRGQRLCAVPVGRLRESRSTLSKEKRQRGALFRFAVEPQLKALLEQRLEHQRSLSARLAIRGAWSNGTGRRPSVDIVELIDGVQRGRKLHALLRDAVRCGNQQNERAL